MSLADFSRREEGMCQDLISCAVEDCIAITRAPYPIHRRRVMAKIVERDRVEVGIPQLQ